jgi:4-hydroxybenzoate polyprenyltransferase
MQDEEFDRSQHLRSIPVWLGKRGTLLLSTLFHLCAAVLVIWAGVIGGFGPLYWTGSAIFIALLVYQHLLVKPDDLSRVNLAFMNTNGVASVVFAFFVISELWLRHIASPFHGF